MNEKIRCISNTEKRKTAMNEWESDDFDIFRTWYSVYKRIRAILFPYLLVNLFKQGYFSFVKIYKKLNKFVS